MKLNHFDFALSSHSRQRGIGFIGFLVGIVVGIAVALAVAVYITKVPTPFTDKSGVKTKEELAAEQERAKNWNPNAPLAGGASGTVQQTEQAPAVLPAPEQASTSTPATGESGAPAPALPGWEGTVDNTANQEAAASREQMLEQARAEEKAKLAEEARKQELARLQAQAQAEAQANASADPIGSLLQARNQTTQKTAKPKAGGFIYFVQVGAFREASGAERQKARVSMLGMQARVNRRKRAGRNVYQVRLGPFQNKSQADAARQKLAGSGMDTALVRVQR